MSAVDKPHEEQAPSQAESGRIEGWTEWAGKVREVLALAVAQPVSLMMLDEDFNQWPLSEIASVHSLEQWSLAAPRGARCTLLARRWTDFPRVHPRWLRWRATWAHKVDCRALLDEELSSMLVPRPTLVLQGVMGMQMLDAERGTGLWSRRASTLAEWWQFGDAISQRSPETMPVTTAGL